MVSLFKTFINFLLEEFEELVQLVIQIIINHASSTGERYHNFKQPSKLYLEQHLFNFILYMKHDNVTKYDVFFGFWNWSKRAINDDNIVIVSCINFFIICYQDPISHNQGETNVIYANFVILRLHWIYWFPNFRTIPPIKVNFMREKNVLHEHNDGESLCVHLFGLQIPKGHTMMH
jgi:hypothetical protein